MLTDFWWGGDISVEMWPCSSAYRISPVDVTSRPSSCLTNFLLGGRSVMLELPRHSGVSGGGSGSSSGGPSGSGDAHHFVAATCCLCFRLTAMVTVQNEAFHGNS